MSNPRAIIAVDVDEVCADMLGAVCSRFRDMWRTGDERWMIPMYRGEPVPETSRDILPEDISQWDLKPYFGPHWWEAIKEVGFYRTVQPVPGARRGVHTLLGLGYRVIYVTSCVPGTADAKQQWLLDWGFLTEKNAMRDFFAVSDKSLVKADALFDDNVNNVESFPKLGVLVNHWHNRSTPCKQRRIGGLFEAPALLSELGW